MYNALREMKVHLLCRDTTNADSEPIQTEDEVSSENSERLEEARIVGGKKTLSPI